MMTLEQQEYRCHPAPREYFPEHKLVADHMSRMTSKVAATVRRYVSDMQKSQEILSKKEKIALIDTAAADILEYSLERMPFEVRSDGCEGEKEKHNGKLGVAMPTVRGHFGGGNGEVSVVIDPVEGTTAAAADNPGAISVVAVENRNGIMATPEGIHYMEKLFAPPKAVGKVSIEKSVTENLEAVRDAYGVDPSRINVVILNRPRNQKHIEEAIAFGATVKLIEGGDLVPSLLAVLPPETHSSGIHVVIGSGGWEEGIISAVAARAVGGVAEGKVWTEDVLQGKTFPRLTLDDLVPGKKEHAMVIYSAITDEPWFHTPGAIVSNREASVSTVMIDKSGVSRWGEYMSFR